MWKRRACWDSLNKHQSPGELSLCWPVLFERLVGKPVKLSCCLCASSYAEVLPLEAQPDSPIVAFEMLQFRPVRQRGKPEIALGPASLKRAAGVGACAHEPKPVTPGLKGGTGP